MQELVIPGLDRGRFGGHANRLGVVFHASGPDWVELALPYRADMIGDVAGGVLASGPIVAVMDMAGSIAIWLKRGRFVPHATLDLRVDYLRGARPGATVIGRCECYRLARSVSFIRGQAHDGDPDDPIAQVAGTYMTLDAGSA